MKATFKIEGMDKLKKDLERLGKVPQKHVTQSAKKGMNIVLKDAKANAQIDDGDLKRGIVLNGEKSKHKGKKVYQVVFDDKMNDVFQKPIQNPVNAKRNIAYYPASQEYGYFLRDGTYMPGLYFMHNALNNNAPRVAKTIINHMQGKIDAEIRKVGLK